MLLLRPISTSLLLAVATALPASAETRWSATSGDWADASNWSYGIPEGDGNPAIIANGGTATVSRGEAQLNGMRVGDSGDTGTLVIAGGTAVTTDGTPNASVVAESDGSRGSILITGGTVTGGGFRLAHPEDSEADATIAGGTVDLVSIALGSGKATLTVSGGDIDLKMFNNPNPAGTLVIEGGKATFDTQDYLAFGGKTILRLGKDGLTTITGNQNINWSPDITVEGAPTYTGQKVGDSFFFLDWDGNILNEEAFMALDGHRFTFADGSEGEFIIDPNESRAAITINTVSDKITKPTNGGEKADADEPAEPQ